MAGLVGRQVVVAAGRVDEQLARRGDERVHVLAGRGLPLGQRHARVLPPLVVKRFITTL